MVRSWKSSIIRPQIAIRPACGTIISSKNTILVSRLRGKVERRIWQRRNGECMLHNERDLVRHMDYIQATIDRSRLWKSELRRAMVML